MIRFNERFADSRPLASKEKARRIPQPLSPCSKDFERCEEIFMGIL
jgi:hypothetical protein